jgi:DivIVA domain-containing protein
MRTEDIVTKVFTRAFMGYDIEQVDVFLDEVIEALERYESEKQEMLSAMEYLMKKLERGQTMPLADMKKAIGPGRTAAVKQPSAETAAQEQKAAARSIARGAGASKPMRAPKVSRVKADQAARDEIIRQAQAGQKPMTPEEAQSRAKRVAAAAANWLDELLINISEHESTEYDKPPQPKETDAQTDEPAPPETESAQPEEGQPNA